ncbi:MAG: caa(3)-type oxidase subunit IV [Deltaproteobacteria bacterium]|nr:MAG: caa(3)-type oxidase subunit IV [Deltaproteobacteria bacterium]
MSEEHTHHPNYVKIWAILVALLVVSVIGPMFEIRVVTLITAFGIAVVKAYMVAKNFMHINIAQRYVTYLVATVLLFMLLFFAGTAPDVMKPEGSNWVKPSWKEAAVERDLPLEPAHH